MKLSFKPLIALACGLLFLSSATVLAQKAPSDKIIRMINLEEYKAAAAEINQQLSTNPSNATALYEKGYLYMAEEKYDAARDIFREGIKAAKKYPYNHIGLATAYHKLGLLEDRDNSIAQAIKMNKSEDVFVMIALADAYTLTEQYGDSKTTLYKARIINSNEPKVHKALGDMNFAKKVYQSAQEDYEAALELEPTMIGAMLNLAKIYIIQKKYQEALILLNKAIKLDSSLAPAYRERGELYLKAGSGQAGAEKKEYFQKARDDYKKYLELEGNDIRAKLRYASFLYLSENYQECLNELEKIDTVTLVSQRLRGYCAMEMGDLEKAKAEMQKYFDMAPPEKVLAEDYQTMANLYLKEKDDEKAAEYFILMAAKAAEKGNDNLSGIEKQFETLVNRFKKEKDAAREVFYWEQLIENRSGGASTVDYYGLGMAARKLASEIEAEKDMTSAAATYVKAKLAMAQVVELTPDYAPAQFWLGYIKEQIKNTDSTSEESAKPWPGLAEYEKVWELLGSQSLEGMNNGDKYYLANTSLYLSLAKFIPNRDDNYNCEAAQPFIAKAQEIDPDIATRSHGEAIKTILETCEGGGK